MKSETESTPRLLTMTAEIWKAHCECDEHSTCQSGHAPSFRAEAEAQAARVLALEQERDDGWNRDLALTGELRRTIESLEAERERIRQVLSKWLTQIQNVTAKGEIDGVRLADVQNEIGLFLVRGSLEREETIKCVVDAHAWKSLPPKQGARCACGEKQWGSSQTKDETR